MATSGTPTSRGRGQRSVDSSNWLRSESEYAEYTLASLNARGSHTKRKPMGTVVGDVLELPRVSYRMPTEFQLVNA